MRAPRLISRTAVLRRRTRSIRRRDRLRTVRLAWIGPLALLAAVAVMPARAGEVTVESIIDQSTALREASAQVPPGGRIVSTECSQVALPGLSFRYRCSVQFVPAAAAPAPSR